MLLLDKNYFDLLGLPRAFGIDEQALETSYRELVSAVHPDRFVTESPEQRRLAMQAAALANEAWRCLRDPCERAAYLCQLAGTSVEAAARSHGLIVNAIGTDVIRVAPPLILSDADLDVVAERWPRVLDADRKSTRLNSSHRT